jgi:hypothetical protein
MVKGHKARNQKRRYTMSQQGSQQVAAPIGANREGGKGFKFRAAAAVVIVIMVLAAGNATAGTSSENNNATNPQNVNVVKTPTINGGNTAGASIANTPSVNVMNTSAVSISGAPSVNANVQFTANQAVTVTLGSATNVGR